MSKSVVLVFSMLLACVAESADAGLFDSCPLFGRRKPKCIRVCPPNCCPIPYGEGCAACAPAAASPKSLTQIQIEDLTREISSLQINKAENVKLNNEVLKLQEQMKELADRLQEELNKSEGANSSDDE